ncbi:NrpR regulatory domain-containing protein [Natrialbaceae archaeon GCM10025810]|uniref:NrpR regulatory domain-containing protein n=1 Tax=Halovalidus salilacus TaxID=3075124 RepID=UPI003618C788
MKPDLDRRAYDLIRLVDRHAPIGSIQLVELMQERGYDIKDRTIRLMLSELDELGYTEKVPGQGRRLTQSGRMELKQGDVNGRLEQIRARIATLTSRVSYDPLEDAGSLVVSAAFLDEADIDEALELLERLDSLPFGPLQIGLEEATESEPGDFRLLTPSSITLDGVLLSHGVNADLATAGVLEYEPTEHSDDGTVQTDGSDSCGGRIVRYVDVINGEGSSIDVISLLIEAGRSDVTSIIENGDNGLLIGDDREFPINRFDEARDLTASTRESLGGAFQFHRPREQAQLPSGNSAWAFGSITYVGPGELLLTALAEYGLSDSWETLYGTTARNRLGPVLAASHSPSLDD